MSESAFDPRYYVPPPDLLQDRVVLVTGASDGIGRALATACAALGARVVLSGRKQRKLEAVYDAIVTSGGPRPSIAPLDFEKADGHAYEALAQAIGNEFGRLDGLAHIAAQLGERTPIEHCDVATWMRVMHVNLNAPFMLTKVLMPWLRASQDASVVFASSGVSVRGRPYWGAYGVSKFALEGLMQALASETDTTTHIRFNSTNPGRARTAMRALAYPGEDRASVPAPETLLAPFLYLLGPASQGVTGLRFESQ
jgi:NAD(P)-dependent dehydrogenase (short-subunit alcohol dehydrogenase family)